MVRVPDLVFKVRSIGSFQRTGYFLIPVMLIQHNDLFTGQRLSFIRQVKIVRLPRNGDRKSLSDWH